MVALKVPYHFGGWVKSLDALEDCGAIVCDNDLALGGLDLQQSSWFARE
jgi:hypothetical protein